MSKVLLLLSLLFCWSKPTLPVHYIKEVDKLDKQMVLTSNDQLTIITNDLTACEGGSVILSSIVNNGIAPFTYAWSGPNSFNSNLANPTITNLATANLGTYQITVMDATNATATATCLLYTSPSPRDQRGSRMPSSA